MKKTFCGEYERNEQTLFGEYGKNEQTLWRVQEGTEEASSFFIVEVAYLELCHLVSFLLCRVRITNKIYMSD